MTLNHWARVRVPAGTFFSKSYVQTGEKDAYNYSVSVGYSAPVDKSGSLLNFGLEYGNSLSAPALRQFGIHPVRFRKSIEILTEKN